MSSAPTPTPTPEPTPTPTPEPTPEPTNADPDPTAGIGEPSPDQARTLDETGASQLLSTATSNGLPDPYADQGGWRTASSVEDPFTAASVEINPFTGATATADPYSESAPFETSNPYTGGRAIDPFSFSYDKSTLDSSPSAASTAPMPSEWSQMVASNGPLPSPEDRGLQTISSLPFAGQPPIDRVAIEGHDYLHYQVTIDGRIYDAYVNDRMLPGQAMITPADVAPTASVPSSQSAPPTPTPTSSGAGAADWQPRTPTRPDVPIVPAAPAIPGGAAAGSLFIVTQPNWVYRALTENDPSAARIRAGADLRAYKPSFPNVFKPATSLEDMTFRHTRPSGNALLVGSDRVSAARNLDEFKGSGKLASRGRELVRIDITRAEQLGTSFYETRTLIDHLKAVERQVLRDLRKAIAESRGKNYIKTLRGRLSAVREARAYVETVREVEAIERIPSRAISSVSGRGVGAAAAREASFLRTLRIVRYGGRVLLVIGIALSIDRVATTPADGRARVLVQEATGWAVSLGAAAAGAKAGAAIGAALGIETGPGAIVTGAIGAIVGGVFAFIAGEKLGGAAYDAGEHLMLDERGAIEDPNGPIDTSGVHNFF